MFYVAHPRFVKFFKHGWVNELAVDKINCIEINADQDVNGEGDREVKSLSNVFR